MMTACYHIIFLSVSLILSYVLHTKAQFTIILKVEPTVVEDGGTVVLSWTDAVIQPVTDKIIYSCGPTNDLTDFIDIISLVVSNESLHVIRISNLVNMRCDYVFSLVRNISGSLQVIVHIFFLLKCDITLFLYIVHLHCYIQI